ncbi:MAG: hypothetical protein WA859_14220 [Candidatus Sulfotelmatobacter sp.]
MPVPVTIVRVKARWVQHLFRYAACVIAAEFVAQIYLRIVHVKNSKIDFSNEFRSNHAGGEAKQML